MFTRRKFLKTGGLLALSVPLLKNRVFANAHARSLPALGIQLYMVKEDMERDARDTLKQIGRMGYTQIESYEGNKGVFWGMNNRDFCKMAKDYGLDMVSTHYAGDSEGYKRLAAGAAEVGIKYLIYPWKGPQKSIDDFKHIADEFNHYGAICKKNGLRFAYHAHDYPYKPVDGQLPIDVLLAGTDKDLVDFQMDFYYTVTEGKDPVAYIRKYSPRFRLCHMRDVLKKRLPENSGEESACDLGTGIIDYPQLLTTCLDNGMEYFFVEQSRFFNETPLQSAAVNAEYLINLKSL
ncbi:MAG TPA: sugar phosphate isomerase/epimerase [Mucilaginibacter sp.]|nr:sugar phosphate isomerase/epimerase [Mucilaginibacter sp.]